MKVGFIGLGTMGASMAANLQKAGYELVVHDIRRAAAERHLAAGAVWADSPKALAEQCEVIFTSLPGPPEVEAVALGENGLLAGMKPDTAYFDLSTNSPTLVRQINAKFAEKNVYMLDAPVSGGPKGAASGKLALWIGGDEQQFNRHKKVLDAIGDAGALYRPDRRRLGRQAGAQLRRLRDPDLPCRGVHDGRQGRCRAAGAVGGGAPGRRRPAPHLRRAWRSFPARQIRPAGLSRCASRTRT
jgi:6-phosphogluconate dehydrogenase (decarboxylating)